MTDISHCIPKYRESDPTPIIAYSFAFFFGIMLSDVVYALGVMLLAKFLLRKIIDNPESEGFRLFQRLIYVSSGVALVFGLLTGAYLGNIYQFLGFENFALVPQVRQTLGDPISFIVLSLIIEHAVSIRSTLLVPPDLVNQLEDLHHKRRVKR